jgi:hypothetical protein
MVQPSLTLEAQWALNICGCIRMDKQVIDFVYWFDPRYFAWVKRRPNFEGNLIAHGSVHMSQVIMASQWEIKLL